MQKVMEITSKQALHGKKQKLPKACLREFLLFTVERLFRRNFHDFLHERGRTVTFV